MPRDDRDLNSSRANRASRAREEAVVKRWKSPVRAPPRRAAEALRALRSVPFRPLGAMSFCDKAFSCAWLGDDLALIGTKDNRLFELEIDRRGRRDVWREIELGREDQYTRNRAMEVAARWASLYRRRRSSDQRFSAVLAGSRRARRRSRRRFETGRRARRGGELDSRAHRVQRRSITQHRRISSRRGDGMSRA